MDNTPNTPNDETIAAKKALAEALRNGDPVFVTPTGEVELKKDIIDTGSVIQVPDGKLA